MENERRRINYLTPDVQQYFKVPDKGKSLMQNENLAGFMVLLLQILDHESPSYSGDQQPLYTLLQKKLTFLHAFLGDTPFRCIDSEDIKNVLVEFESLANEAGGFIYSCVSASSDEIKYGNFDVGIHSLLGKVEALNANIKELCFEEIHETTPSSCSNLRSAFIIDSLLEDIERLNGPVGVVIDDIKDLIKTLVDELNFSKTSVKDVEVPQVGHTNELRESLILIIVDATYEAEYLINSYTVGHFPSWYLNLRLPVVVQKIKLTRTRLKGVNEIQDVENVKIVSGLARDVSSKEVRNPEAVLERVVIGFDDVTKQILEDLTGRSEKLQIISIFGMPGSGKTTLANKLYNDPLICGYFYMRMWCTVSQTYVKKKVFHDILTSLGLSKAKISEMDDESLRLVIYKGLKGNKYLIVIDDIWDSSTWEDLRRYFPDDSNGSRILFTSRIKDSAPSNSIFHSPPVLLVSECHDLLLKKVFKNEACPPVLSRIAMRIASKCHGLPLAVVVVAGILANLELDETMWRNIKANLDSYLDDSGIDLLELSYKHLPDRLKPCFLYLGAFSRNEEIVTEKLIPMWIAQGFVLKEEPRSQESIAEGFVPRSQESIAEQYLTDLINRSLLEIVKTTSDGRVKSCRFHDLLHDVCLQSGNKEKFMQTINVFSPVYQKYSHLSLYPLLSNTCSISAPRCRSISGFIPYLGNSVAQMPLLRAINVFELSTNNVIDVLRRICGLIHLRYLSCEDAMPQDICKLVNLEYLHVDTSSTVYAPSAILKMEKLRHIRISSEVVFDKKCDMSQITNNIKSLLQVCIRNHEEEKILKCLPHIQKLKCICNGLFPDLTTFTNLESLNVVIFAGPIMVGLTEINFPLNLKRLTLSGTCFPWEETSVIGRLPNLHVLKLLCDAFVGEEWKTRDGEFQELRFLKLCNIAGLREWTTASYEHFPGLECLVLDHVLVEIPSEFSYIASLRTIEVHNCGHAVYTSATQIEEEQRDYGNEHFKIITSGFVNEEINRAKALSVSKEDEEGENIKVDDVSQSDKDEWNKEDEEWENRAGNVETANYKVSQLEEDELLDKEELGRAIALSISEEDNKAKMIIDDFSPLEDGEVLVKAFQENLEMEDSRAPQFEYGSFFPPYPFYPIPNNRICAGCELELMKGRSTTCMGSVWHPECFLCHACKQPIFDIQFTIFVDRPYHNSCKKKFSDELQILRCYICKKHRADGRNIQFSIHPFWQQRYCPSHETDGTPKCSSCERFEVLGSTHLIIGDGRTLCLECLESSIMDTNDAQSLYLAIRDFFEGLNMKLKQQFPLFLVESQVLGEGDMVSYVAGRCLFKQEGQGLTTPNVNTEPSERGLVAIQVLFGHPRLWTGTKIVYYMMQAWLWLQGYCAFAPGVGEGICTVLEYMWLEAEYVAGSSKKGKRSEFEKKLGECFKHKIESDPRPAYGDGFREGMKAVETYGLEKTLDRIRLTGCFPC